MPLHDLLQGDGPLFTAADAFQGAFGQIQVLDLFQVLEDGFTDIVGLGAPGTPGKLLQALFDGLRKSNGQHNYLAIQVYHNVHGESRTTLRTPVGTLREEESYVPYVHRLPYCEHTCYAQNGRMSVWP